jgi:hypothetical protein
MIIVENEFPRATELNSILYDRVKENIIDNKGIRHSDGLGGRRTDWFFHEQKIEEIDVLVSWIHSILPDVSKRFAAKESETIENWWQGPRFEIAECWGVNYIQGESLVEHCHFPYTLSFVYYVRTPKGTAPIIIENEIFEIKEGQCIFFLASHYHRVGLNDCDGRCAIVGNILYNF